MGLRPALCSVLFNGKQLNLEISKLKHRIYSKCFSQLNDCASFA